MRCLVFCVALLLMAASLSPSLGDADNQLPHPPSCFAPAGIVCNVMVVKLSDLATHMTALSLRDQPSLERIEFWPRPDGRTIAVLLYYEAPQSLDGVPGLTPFDLPEELFKQAPRAQRLDL